jgi:HSP20 family protein
MKVLAQWHPIRDMRREMRRFQRDMDRLAGHWGIDLPTWPSQSGAYPSMNIWEDNDFVHAEAELAGLKLADLEITVTGDDQLTIKGKRDRKTPEGVEWHRQERRFGGFERSLTLPVSVDSTKIQACLENGVLTIKMAKSEAAKPRKITVKTE